MVIHTYCTISKKVDLKLYKIENLDITFFFLVYFNSLGKTQLLYDSFQVETFFKKSFLDMFVLNMINLNVWVTEH